MRLYYVFLFVSLFVQTPEAEFLMSRAGISAVQHYHGSVEVTQGRSSVDVRVKCEGRFLLQLVRVSDEVVVDSEGGVDYGEFSYERSRLSASSYEVRVVFIDEAFRVEAVRIELRE